MNDHVTLLIPEKTDTELDQIANAWTSKGNVVKRLGRYWIKDEALTRQQIAVYGNQAFGLVLAQIYNLVLVSPDDTLLITLDRAWTKRAIQLTTIAQIKETDFPTFIKPVVPKMFTAGIFQNQQDFATATAGLPNEEQVLQSTIIDDITAEARCYVMNSTIFDLALYEGIADLQNAKAFVIQFIQHNRQQIPSPVVIDIAYSNSVGWFLLEFNACWGAGLNNCRAEKVVECIVCASIPLKH